MNIHALDMGTTLKIVLIIISIILLIFFIVAVVPMLILGRMVSNIVDIAGQPVN